MSTGSGETFSQIRVAGLRHRWPSWLSLVFSSTLYGKLKWPKHCDVCKSFKLTKRKKARPTGFGYSGSQGLFLKYRIHNLLSQERYELFRSSQKLWGFDFKNVTTLRYIGSLMEQDRVHQYSTNPWAEITRREPQSISEVHSWTK